MSLLLHKEKGVNPRVTVCTNCGRDNGGILLGIHQKIYKCRKCGLNMYGGKSRGMACPSCKSDDWEFVREINESEKIPNGLCTDCLKDKREFAAEVARGGIYFTCKDCGSNGVIKAGHPLAEDVRKRMNVLTPKPCGIEYTKSTCPVCAMKDEFGDIPEEERGKMMKALDVLEGEIMSANGLHKDKGGFCTVTFAGYDKDNYLAKVRFGDNDKVSDKVVKIDRKTLVAVNE